MKKLDNEFEGKGEVSGTHFKKLKESEFAFMYELTDLETCQKRYEVFEKRVSKEGEAIIAGQTVKYEEKEVYPKSNAFGDWAWCISDLDKANERFTEIETYLTAKDGKANNS